MSNKVKAGSLRPIHDKVIVLPDPEEKELVPGFEIPVESREKQTIGTVVAVGRGLPGEPTEVKPGDRVLYPKHGNNPIMVNNKPHVIMKEDNIYSIINSKEDGAKANKKSS